MEASSQLHTPAALPLGKKTWYPIDRRGLVGLRAPLDAMEKGKIFPPPWNRTPAVQPVAIQLQVIKGKVVLVLN
jgi:hypothetical protein